MKKNFTQLIPASTWLQPQLAVKATLLFLLMLVFHAASAQAPSINTTNPSCVAVQQGFELTINGSDFDDNGATVVITGNAFSGEFAFTPKSRTSSQLKVDIPAGDTVLAAPGALTITVRQNGTDVSNPVQISVNPTTTTITGPASVCVSTTANTANFRVPALAGSTTYAWRIISGPATITSGGTTPEAIVRFNNTSGTVKIGVTIDPDCNGTPNITSTHDIILNAAPDVTLSTFGDNGNICTNAGVLTLTGGQPLGGEYTVDGIVATTFDPTNALGEHTIVYYYTTLEGCQGSATQKINVVKPPVVSLGQFADVCVNAAAFPLIGGTPGNGTYLVNDEPATEFNPALVGVGTHTITYVVVQGGCRSIATQSITVLEAPDVSLTEFADVCSDAGLITLTGGFPLGGTYSGPGVTNGQFNPAVAGVGTHNISYTFKQGDCIIIESQTITVLQAHTANLAPFTNVCVNAAAFPLSGGTPDNGIYSGPGVSDGQFNPAVAGVGTHTITYTFDQNGCKSSATRTITVVQPVSVTITTPIGTQGCPEQGGIKPAVPLTVANIAGAAYQWLLNGNEIPGATTINLNATQSGNYSVRVTNNGCSIISAAVAVTILDPATFISEGALVRKCLNQTIVLHAIAGNYTYQWYKDGQPLTGQTTAELSVNQPGEYTVVLTTQIGSCRTITSTPTTVLEEPAITNNNINAPTDPVCSGGTITIVGVPATGGTGGPYIYQWQISSAIGGPYSNVPANGNGQNYLYEPGAFSGTQYFRRIVISGGCNNISDPVPVIVVPAIAGNTINNTNTKNICEGGSITIGASPQTGLTGGGGPRTYAYQWQESTDNATFTNIQGATTQNYTYNSGSFVGTKYLRRVVSSGSCTSTTVAVAVNVNPAIVGNTISPNRNPICATTSVVITGSSPEGGTGSYSYQWQSSTDSVNFSDIPGATAKNYSFTSNNFVGTQYFRRIVTSRPVNTNSCSSTSDAVSVTVNPPIAGNNEIITDSRSLCTGTSLIIEATPATGGGGNIRYKWQSSPDNINFTDLTPNYSVNNQNYLYSPGDFVGEVYFRRVVNSGDGCIDISSVSVKITVQKTSTYTLILNANPFPVCGETVYTAKVYRDVTSVTYPTEPQYGEATVVGGTDVTDQFTFDWWKNDTELVPSNNSSQITIIAPQSRDYYTVRARPSTVAPVCFLYNNRPDLVPSNRGINELFSNRIYRGTPIGYAVSIATNVQPSNVVCAGVPVTFTATPSKANFVNPTYQWQVNGQNIQGATGSTFTSSTLNSGDIVTATFTSAENRCDPITSNAITMLVASPQVLSGGGSYCATDQVGGVAIQLEGSQLGVNYQLMLGTTKVFLPIPGDGGPISFGYHKYAPGTYSVQAITAAGTCAPFGSVTVSHTPALNHTVTIQEPEETIIGEPATFIATSSIASAGPTYRWYVINYNDPNPTFVLQPNAKTNVFTINAVPEGDIEVRVEVVAPIGLCTNDADGIAFALTGPIAPLPVELLYLKATKQNNDVVAVEWATAMEQNSEGFEVQVSQDAKNYRTLAFVASKAGGNTNQKQVYTFHDKENGKYGIRYYRLMQRDINGDAEYFGPKAVQIGEATESLSVYPNPFSSEVSLELNAEEAGIMHVLVTNAIGAKVLERTLTIQKGNNKQSLQFKADLPLGMYHITTRLNGKTRHIKLMKQ
ncbi:T9SS type A sorting domain-containing protein [Adhaeribacter rhizoryzae]|uniref:T9SS type A sorting domain-containing protein n=1 Tax=Adhaeribacter rhizoryzae TaxID=2607907 RepID=A0A5M6DBS1_9BACT|nr:T9SS type A sorting domain-containing protein [Adhaeribacter rhizoryzae]KAA5544994.1 T9SS type A sorting domain-containing protein [Adhaeribacter rhizoryzae]